MTAKLDALEYRLQEHAAVESATREEVDGIDGITVTFVPDSGKETLPRGWLVGLTYRQPQGDADIRFVDPDQPSTSVITT